LPEEIDFLLDHVARYLAQPPKRCDVLSVFTGLRPLYRSTSSKETALLPRDHAVLISKSGLVTITGGKWTTYRKMAEDTVSQAALAGGLPETPAALWISTCTAGSNPIPPPPTALAGSLTAPISRPPYLGHRQARARCAAPSALALSRAEVLWAVRHEMARTLEDVLARRTRALFSMRAQHRARTRIARPHAADSTTRLLDRLQVTAFNRVAENYSSISWEA